MVLYHNYLIERIDFGQSRFDHASPEKFGRCVRTTILIGAKRISQHAAAAQNQPKLCFTLDAEGIKVETDELRCCNLSTSVRKGVLNSPSSVTKDRAKSTITFLGVTHGEGHFCVPPAGKKNVVTNASSTVELYAS